MSAITGAVSAEDLHLHQVKILYWGPGESGKTTSYHHLQQVFAKHRISAGFSIASTQDRTLWGDSVHFEFPIPRFQLRLVVIVGTATGQLRFLTTREYVLQNADGVIFVGDSDPLKLEENVRSFQELITFTRGNGIPILVQLNKRDLPQAITEADFRTALHLPEVATDATGARIVYPTVATAFGRDDNVKLVFLDLLHKIIYRYFLQQKTGAR